ncbi:MAG: RibD family protein [Thermoplasmata archaeon]|nr:MAG: RibD family protein [Thermoplasmata archaeon]
MLPKVILHNAVSVDGRMDNISPDLAVFYKLAATWKEGATVVGSNTLLSAPDEIPPETEEAFKPITVDPEDKRPYLVVPDSRGRLKSWHYWRSLPYWKKPIVLCSNTTPKEHLEYLKKRHVEYIVAGEDHVDMRKALEELSRIYGVNTVRLDSGGTLNGVLLREGLVDEISVMVIPTLVGGTTPTSIFIGPDLTSEKGVLKLKLIHFEKLEDDYIWLRYEVVG